MAEFVGGESISVGVDEPITFENKTDDSFSVDVGIVFRKSGLYRVSVVGKHTSVEIEPERKKGKWTEKEVHDEKIIDKWQSARCPVCGKYHTTPYMYYFNDYPYCPHCGSQMEGGEDDVKHD